MIIQTALWALIQPPQSFGLSTQISTYHMLCSFYQTNFAGTGACSKIYLFRKGSSREVTTPYEWTKQSLRSLPTWVILQPHNHTNRKCLKLTRLTFLPVLGPRINQSVDRCVTCLASTWLLVSSAILSPPVVSKSPCWDSSSKHTYSSHTDIWYYKYKLCTVG